MINKNTRNHKNNQTHKKANEEIKQPRFIASIQITILTLFSSTSPINLPVNSTTEIFRIAVYAIFAWSLTVSVLFLMIATLPRQSNNEKNSTYSQIDAIRRQKNIIETKNLLIDNSGFFLFTSIYICAFGIFLEKL